jgi:REP element-mobilizing transposase RayT
MADSYTNLLYHIVFSTKDRRRLITSDIEPQLYDYIGGIVRGLGGISLALNGVEDHVHLLAKLRPDCALSDVLRDLKANASGCSKSPTLFVATWIWGFYSESVKRQTSVQIYFPTKGTSHEAFVSRRIYSILESQRYRV